MRVRARVREKVGRRVGEGLQRERREWGRGDAGVWRQTGRVSSDTLCSQFSGSGTRFEGYRRALNEVDAMREFCEDPMRESWKGQVQSILKVGRLMDGGKRC